MTLACLLIIHQTMPHKQGHGRVRRAPVVAADKDGLGTIPDDESQHSRVNCAPGHVSALQRALYWLAVRPPKLKRAQITRDREREHTPVCMTLFQYPFNTCFGNRERTSFDRTVLLGPLRCNQRQLAYTASESGGREKERAEGSRRGRRAQRERNGSAVGRTERMEHLSRRPRGGVQLTSRGPCAAQARTGENCRVCKPGQKVLPLYVAGP